MFIFKRIYSGVYSNTGRPRLCPYIRPGKALLSVCLRANHRTRCYGMSGFKYI